MSQNNETTLLDIAGGVISDFAKAEVPGSVVIVIIAIMLSREAYGLWTKWRSKK